MSIQLTASFANLGATIAQAEGELGDVVISFDVFDTLIHRRVSTRFITDKVNRHLEHRLDEMNVNVDEPIYETHNKAIEILRLEAEARGDDREVRLEEVTQRWIELAVKRSLNKTQIAKLTTELVEFEMDCEKQACFPNLEARAVVEQLALANKRFIFVSDMYIGSARVAELLDACGYPPFSAGYASGDNLHYKVTGRLFHEMLDAEGLAPENVLHIGDNFDADVKGAQRCHLNTIWLDAKEIAARKTREIYDHDAVLADRRNISFVVHEAATDDLPAPSTLAQEYGQHLVGPMAAAFTQRLGEAARFLDIDALYFLARDGFLFQRVYEALGEANPEFRKVPARYLYTSRLPTLRALSLNGISIKALISAKNHLVPNERTIANTFTSIGLDRHMTASIGRRYGVNDPDRFFDDGVLHWPPFQNLLSDPEIVDAAHAVAADNRAKISDYLTQAGFFNHRRVGLVDIGWGGSIQDQLRDILQDDPRLPDLHGFYVGGNQSLFFRRLPGNWMDGVMSVAFTPDNLYPLGNAATFGFMGALEELARAPQGTTLGYQRNDQGRIEPILRSDSARPAEVAAEPELMSIQRGAVEYAERYAKSIFLLDATSEETLPIGRTALQRLVYYPTNAEVRLWQRMAHTNDIGTFEIDEALVAPATSTTQDRIRALGTARRTTWRHGSLRQLLGPIGQWLFQHGLLVRDVAQRQRSWNADRGSAPYHHNTMREKPRPAVQRSGPAEPDTSDEYRHLVQHAEALAQNDSGEPPIGLTLFDMRTNVMLASMLGFSRAVRRPLLRNFRVINDGLPIRQRVSRSLGLHEVEHPTNPVRAAASWARGAAQRRLMPTDRTEAASDASAATPDAAAPNDSPTPASQASVSTTPQPDHTRAASSTSTTSAASKGSSK